MKSRPPSFLRGRNLLGAALLGALALTFPVWIDRLAREEPRLHPVADIFAREEPGRVAPEATDDGLRQRLETQPPTALDPAPRRRVPQHETEVDGLLFAPPLPRSFEPDSPFGH